MVSVIKADGKEEAEKTTKSIEKTKDDIIISYLDDMIRYIVDTEEELANISFYRHLIRDSIL